MRAIVDHDLHQVNNAGVNLIHNTGPPWYTAEGVGGSAQVPMIQPLILFLHPHHPCLRHACCHRSRGSCCCWILLLMIHPSCRLYDLDHLFPSRWCYSQTSLYLITNCELAASSPDFSGLPALKSKLGEFQGRIEPLVQQLIFFRNSEAGDSRAASSG